MKAHSFEAAAKAGVIYFAIVFGAGFVLGAVRVPLLVPRLGERLAELLEMPIMFMVIFLAARYTTKRFAPRGSPLVRVSIGLTGLVLLVSAELLFAVIVSNGSLAAYVASRDPVSGAVYVVMLLIYAAMPAIIGRRGMEVEKTPQ